MMLRFLERFGLVGLLGLAILFFTVHPDTPQFATGANVANILGNESILAIVAIATVIPLVAGQIDLSVGPAAGLSSVIVAGLMSKSDSPMAVAVLAGIAVGASVGLINGVLVAKVGINSIITTLGSASIIGAMVLWYSEGVSIATNISPTLTDFGGTEPLGIPMPFYLLLLVGGIGWYVLEHMPVGRQLYAVGTNNRAAELVGLRVPRYVLLSLVASGTLAGMAGVMLVAYQGVGNPQVGQSFTLPALAAAFLGATTIRPGSYNVLGALTAVFFLAVSVNGLTFLGAEAWVADMFNGVALLVAVGVAAVSGRWRLRRSKPQPARESPPAVEARAESPVPHA